MTDELTARMLEALRDIAAQRCGTTHQTERALRRRRLIVDADVWPFVALTPAGAAALAPASFPMALADWQALPREPHWRAPYDRPCPACGRPMVYPTQCKCPFELRVYALAGLEDLWQPWTRANVVAVNRAMRALDDSHSYPILGRFNATDRAIRRVRALEVDGLDGYVRAVDGEIGRIVNS